MKLTVRFECDLPTSLDMDPERRISTRGRDADDVDMILDFWKGAYEKRADSNVRVVLSDPTSDSSIHPADLDVIDTIDDEDEEESSPLGPQDERRSYL